jgi:hypothetical protein
LKFDVTSLSDGYFAVNNTIEATPRLRLADSAPPSFAEGPLKADAIAQRELDAVCRGSEEDAELVCEAGDESAGGVGGYPILRVWKKNW